jgi:hypothetical protein
MTLPLHIYDASWDRAIAHRLASVLRSHGWKARAHATRGRGAGVGTGGWRWNLQVEGAPIWLGSLVIACSRAHPQAPWHELDPALEALVVASDGDDAVLESAWRLGGTEALITLVRGIPKANDLYPPLGYTWSFYDPPDNDGDSFVSGLTEHIPPGEVPA